VGQRFQSGLSNAMIVALCAEEIDPKKRAKKAGEIETI
jgi:hypothetical protein